MKLCDKYGPRDRTVIVRFRTCAGLKIYDLRFTIYALLAGSVFW
jgi:hypothetical protein